MKFVARVIGHEMVQKRVDDEMRTFIKVKLKGEGSMKIELLVDEEDRARYPFGCGATVDFSVQQTLPLEK